MRISNSLPAQRHQAPRSLAPALTLLFFVGCGGIEEPIDEEGVEEPLSAGFTRLQSADPDLLRRCIVAAPQTGHVPTIEYCANSRAGQGWTRQTSGLLMIETSGAARCLTVNPAGNGVVMNGCNAAVGKQKWSLGGVETVAGVTGRRIRANDGRCLTMIGGHPMTLAACGANKKQIWNVINTPTNELNVPVGTVSRPTSPFWTFNASEMTKAVTANAIVRWEATPLAFWLGDEACGGGFGPRRFQLVSNGVALVGLDGAGRPRVKFATATSYDVCDLLPDHTAAMQVSFADGSGEFGSTTERRCSPLSPCDPIVVNDPFTPNPKTRRLLDLMRQDASAAPRPKALSTGQKSNGLVGALQGATSGSVRVGVIFSDGGRATIEKNAEDLPKSTDANPCFHAMSVDPRGGCPPSSVSRSFSLTSGWDCSWGGLEVGECNLACCPSH